MSVVDRVLAAMVPHEKSGDRAQARARARAVAAPDDWLSLALDHHVQIEAAFSAVRFTTDAGSRAAASKELALILTAHSVAEERVLYPALAQAGARGHAELAYEEQSRAKLQLGLLDYLTPMSQEYLDRLEAIREDVLHHMYEEESRWFLELRTRLPPEVQAPLAARYRSEFERYFNDTDWMPGAAAVPVFESPAGEMTA